MRALLKTSFLEGCSAPLIKMRVSDVINLLLMKFASGEHAFVHADTPLETDALI